MYIQGLGVSALLGAIFVLQPNSAGPIAAPASTPSGHLVLVVDGDANQLRVSRVVPKATAFGGVPKGLTSAYELSIRDAAGAELGRYPVDLAHFDLEPTHVGRPLQVTGDIVRDSHVTMLMNVPDFPQAADYVFLRAGAELGRQTGLELQRLQGGGK
jgi:hypothetical protein